MPNNSGFGSALGLGAGIGVGSSLGNAGGIMICNAQNQDTTYCQFVQYFNGFKMVLYFVFVLALIAYLVYYYFSGFSGKKKTRN
jgi:Na+/H+ antiporter NhaC